MATLSGTIVLVIRKGTRVHKQIGYLYAVSMAILNITAFMTYRLFGGFGIFHVAALLSALTLIGGMLPAIQRPKGWIYRHLAFMYWSVIGLYAAFASEVLTRVPETPFFGMVGIATAIIMILGTIIYIKERKKWIVQFSMTS